ncbi:baseplate multidomain protein megatron [Roseibium sp.]|uniref:baseplate multidomain protein megatron n=1 Tax=Roseibium sp. TaxID=1936156 RepID=UPI003A97EC3F
MATLILTAAGQALGGAAGGIFGLGSLGGILGKAAGAIAGNTLDKSLFGSSRTLETGRLADLSVQASNEGAALPRVYGRVRLAGQVIWATRFEEEVTEERQGGKGGGGQTTTVRSYAYYANFAVALCEGPVTKIGRIWADGKLLDTSRLNMRLYTGALDQLPDPLIAGLQGDAPAYRGVAYAVFEHLALESFGNRLPQLTFEVLRSVETLETKIRSVTIIPGAGEFVYQPTAVSATPSPGVTQSLNRHVQDAASDWAASLDELQALCPNLESVALVVAWFGDDLRAGACTIRPLVEERQKPTSGATWSVAGLARSAATEVSRVDGKPAYGGTPSDASVIAAIKDLKARGLKVMLYPFLLLDIPAGNGLPDPHGGSEQAAYPWRGRIVPHLDTDAEAASFFGSAEPSSFSVSGESVVYSGPSEWRYRRHVLHMAHLALAAGGVDSFLIGSELRGLTQAQGAGGDYPFVDELVALAEDAKSVLGSASAVSYAADWSEYGAHQVSASELRFPLDPLWASSSVDFVGIDNYLPLTDMRGTGDPDGNTDPHDPELLRAAITSGEYFDWYYASDADRRAGQRTPITDGAYGKPWVYRARDLAGWWSNDHHERVGGEEESVATSWVPGSKPIRFTELGVPAVDKGSNQPNVFIDLKSAESALPHFSDGTRDDLIQRRGLEAWLDAFDDTDPDFVESVNPWSAAFSGRMVDPAGMFLWTWDARPYPAFPRHLDVWADGANWRLGHWLNGRLGGLSVSGLLRQLLDDFGISQSDVAVGSLSGSLEGMAVAGPVAARDVIEPLLTAFGGTASDLGTRIRLESASTTPDRLLGPADLVDPDDVQVPILSRTRAQEAELASEVRLGAEDAASDYRRRVAASRRLEVGSRQIETLDLAIVTSPHALQQAADRRLARIWGERERAEFSLSPRCIDVEPGDVLALSGVPGKRFEPPLRLRVESIEDTEVRRVEAVRVSTTKAPVTVVPEPVTETYQGSDPGLPHGIFLDLPPMAEGDPDAPLRMACFAKPWPGTLSLLRSVTGAGFEPVATIERPATMGQLLADLGAGPVAVWDRANCLEVQLHGGLLQSRPELEVLSGRNVLAVRCKGGGHEILQFRDAELIGSNAYRLSTLLRAQMGTEPEMRAGGLVSAETGADVVLLDPETVPLVPVGRDQLGRAYHYRLVPAGLAVDDPLALALTHAASGRGERALAPVHLKARRTALGIRISFTRQTRRSGDSWEQVEVPLGEESEAYEIDILGPGDEVLRTLSATTPEVLYPAADEIADFGAQVPSLSFSVCQLSATSGRGFERKATRHV